MGNLMWVFNDRTDAGRQLADRLEQYADRPDVIVLALPRGGLTVGYEIARALRAPLDVMIVRKLGTPGHPELAMGAVASGGVKVVNHEVLRDLGISSAEFDAIAVRELTEVERREHLYRTARTALQITGRIVILVDDGIATGATMWAAIQAIRAQKPSRLVVAAPTAARSSAEQIRKEVDELICLTTPDPFLAVGLLYRDFPQLTDDDVSEILARAGHIVSARAAEP
jgi:putative phosphoribosyl transferase